MKSRFYRITILGAIILSMLFAGNCISRRNEAVAETPPAVSETAEASTQTG